MFLRKGVSLLLTLIMLLGTVGIARAETTSWATVDNSTKVVTIDLTTEQYPTSAVGVSVWLPDNSADDVTNNVVLPKIAAHIGETQVQEDGKIYYTFTLGEDAPSGTYTVSVKVQGEKDVRSTTVDFADLEKANYVLSVCQSGTADDIEAIFDGKPEGSLNDVDVASFKIWSGYDGDEKEYVATHLEPLTFADLADLQTKITAELGKIEMTKTLRVADRATAKSILENNHETFLLGDMTEYEALTPEQNEEFYVKLLPLLEDCKFPEDVSKQFKLTVTSVQKEKEEIVTKPSGNRGGGGVMIPVGTLDGTIPKEQEAIPPAFSDLDGAEWARTPITVLAEKGIVKGKGNGQFCPNDLITREEVVSLLVNAFDISAVSYSAMPFTDVKQDDWFYECVRIAKQRGMVNGISADAFGAGSYITRQDLAVMLTNAMNLKTLTITEAEEPNHFADDAAISDYAKKAVTNLFNAGIVNGKGNNCFDPMGNATRAETAKMIHAVLLSYNLL